MQWGAELQTLLDIAAETGMVPKPLQDRPTLKQRWEFPKQVFDALTGSRRYTTGGAANIPISEYAVYAKAYGFSPQDWRDVWEDLAIIDTVWLTETTKKREKTKKGT